MKPDVAKEWLSHFEKCFMEISVASSADIGEAIRAKRWKPVLCRLLLPDLQPTEGAGAQSRGLNRADSSWVGHALRTPLQAWLNWEAHRTGGAGMVKSACPTNGRSLLRAVRGRPVPSVGVPNPPVSTCGNPRSSEVALLLQGSSCPPCGSCDSENKSHM